MLGISPIQIIIVIFAIFALTRAILRIKKKDIRPMEFVFWSMLWIAVIIAVFFPGLVSIVANFLGISTGMGFLVYISILLLFYLVFRIYVKLDYFDQRLSKLIRELSIKEADEKKIGRKKKEKK